MSFLHGLNYLHRTVMIVLTIFLTSFMLATGRVPAVVSYLTLQKLGVLILVLQICEFYRQRFYLDPRHEWGFHWRVALLHYAKWPRIMLAFFDVFFKKQKPYVLTRKVKSTSRHHPLVLPNLLVIILLALAWAFGQSQGYVTRPFVSILAAILVIPLGVLIWTDFWEFPPPYQRELQEHQLADVAASATSEGLDPSCRT